MCGIFGLIDFDNKIDQKKDVILKLMKYSSRRGKDSTGIWLSSTKLEHYCILPVEQKIFLKTNEFKKNIFPFIEKSDIVLGLCRLATNGEVDGLENNQPLMKSGLVLAHNGIIVNSSDLAKKFQVKNYQSDSRVLMDVILKLKKDKGLTLLESVKHISKYIIGTLNLVLIDNTDVENIRVIFTSNNGSLYLGDLDNGIVFASEEYFLKKLNIAGIKIKKIVPGKILEVRVNKGDILENNLPISSVIGEQKNIKEKIKTGLEKHKINFDEIDKIRRCSKCILPETTPFIDFDKDGVCNYCREYKKIKHKGLLSLKNVVKKYKSKNGKPDCIIAFSGGRDSSYGLHFLVKVLKLHPVAVTFDWGMLSDVGRRNQSRMLSKLGVEHIVVAANTKRVREDIRKNLEAWLRRPKLGLLPLLMQGDKTTEYYVDKIKRELRIKLVFFCRGNELEREEFKSGYCGIKNADPGGVIHNYYWLDKLKLLSYYFKNFLINPAYLNRSLRSSFLGYLVTFVIPHDYVYLWHYIPWNEDKIIRTLKNNYNWKGDCNSGLTWRVDDGSPAFYNYVYCQIQGFTENDSFRSHQIREKMITRDKALELILKENKPRYDMLSWYFNKIGVEGDSVLSAVDKMLKMY